MKPLFKDKAYLKVLLLVALAANMSWGQIIKVAKTYDTALASEVAGGDTGTPAKGDDAEAKAAEEARVKARIEEQKKNGDVASLPAPQKDRVRVNPAPKEEDKTKADEAKKTEADKDKSDKVETTAKKTVKPEVKRATESYTVEVCEQKFVFNYREIVRDSKLVTWIYAQKEGQKQELVAVSRVGSLKSVMEKKEEIDKELVADLKSNQNLKCEKKEKVAKMDDSDEEKSEKKKRERERDPKRIARDIQDCAIDSKTHEKLDDTEKMECLTDRLSDIDVETDKNGRVKSSSMSKAKALIDGPIKRQLTLLMTSKDEDKISAGEDAVKELKTTVDTLGLDRRQEEQLKGKLSGLQVAGRTARVANDYLEEATTLRTDLRNAVIQARMNQNDPWALASVNQLYSQHANLQAQIDMNLKYGPYAELLSFQQSGLITSADTAPFLAPFNLLNREMSSMIDPKSLNAAVSIGLNSPTSSTLPTSLGFDTPSDLLSLRSGLTRDFRASNTGWQLPTSAPQFNTRGGAQQMGNFGLNSDPRLMGRQPQPMFQQSPMINNNLGLQQNIPPQGQRQVNIPGRGTVNLPVYTQGPGQRL